MKQGLTDCEIVAALVVRRFLDGRFDIHGGRSVDRFDRADHLKLLAIASTFAR
jgi:hypothetical protein